MWSSLNRGGGGVTKSQQLLSSNIGIIIRFLFYNYGPTVHDHALSPSLPIRDEISTAV
jgi:hypothetical protein